jgi:hypothetical protein
VDARTLKGLNGGPDGRKNERAVATTAGAADGRLDQLLLPLWLNDRNGFTSNKDKKNGIMTRKKPDVFFATKVRSFFLKGCQ